MDSCNIDFKEISNFERFEDFVAALLKRKKGVVEVTSTGRGSDYGADIIVTVEREDPILGTKKHLKTIVECKHLAHSNRAVRKGDLSPAESLHIYEADIFLLVTSTRSGPFLTKAINSIHNNNRIPDQRAGIWDASYIETELLKPKNHDLLNTYFPLSYDKVLKRIVERENAISSLKKNIFEQINEHFPQIKENSTLSEKGSHMYSAYLIASQNDRNIYQGFLLRDHAKNTKIDIKTSEDVVSDWLWSLDKRLHYNRFLDKSDAAFAIVTKIGKKSPNVWLEIESAKSRGKLKAIFIDESIYTVTLHGKYPCILLKNNLDRTISGFVTFYRNVMQSWGESSNYWFWFSLDILLHYYDFPKKAN